VTTYLTVEDLLDLTELLGAGPVRDVGLLDAAATRPRASAFGEDAYRSIPEMAAAMLHSIAGNHALVDGNKRLAWLAAVVFLDLNGWTVEVADDEAFDLVMDVAAKSLDVADIVPRLRAVPVAGPA
jgi:death-on-curing protein